MIQGEAEYVALCGIAYELARCTSDQLYLLQRHFDAVIRSDQIGWHARRELQKVQTELKQRGLPVRP